MFQGIYQGKKVFITGNTGFKGSWLSLWLLSLGAEVVGFSLNVPSQPSMYEALQLHNQIKQIYGDIRDLPSLSSAIHTTQPDFIFHLAAQPLVGRSYANPVETFSTNVMGTIHVLESVRNLATPCHVLLITSDKCYDNVEWLWGYRENDRLGGKDPYSGSKGAAEIAIRSYYYSYFKDRTDQCRVVSCRAGNVIGGGDWADKRLVPDCFRAWSQQQSVTIRSPHSTRPWQHVLEALSGYLQLGVTLAQQPKLSGESYNFGPRADQNHSVALLLQELARHWDLGTIPPFRLEEGEFHEADLLKLNCDKAFIELNWMPTLEFPLLTRLTAEWYRHYYEQGENGLLDLTLHQIEEYTTEGALGGRIWAI